MGIQEKVNKQLLRAIERNDLIDVSNLLKGGGYTALSMTPIPGAKLNARDADGNTGLMLAVSLSHQQMALHLLKRNADMHVTNNAGAGILHVAAATGHTDIIQDFINKRLPVNQTDNNGSTPLHYAVRSRVSSAALDVLIKAEADLDKADNQGNTALHVAVEQKNRALVQYLLDKGADINKQNSKGETPLALNFFRFKPSFDITNLLLKRGADPFILTNAGKHPAMYDDTLRQYEKFKAEKKLPAPAPAEVLPAAEKPPRLITPPVAADYASLQQSRLREAFKNEGLDPDAEEQWRPIGNSVIEHVIGSAEQPRILSTTFNFTARQCVSVSKNLLTGQENGQSVQTMDTYANPDYLAEAHQKLIDAGKTPPPLWPKGMPVSVAKAGLGARI